MCGITGVMLKPGARVDPTLLERMTTRLAHRGPDGSGTWISGDGAVGLGHRRLSILDLSAAGAQPMTSPSGRYTIAYNGEIYNFQELRRELQDRGVAFRGHSDTEVMLAAFEQWGIEKALGKCIGMFAFGLWDASAGWLCLARDRIGIKPLYYAETDKGLVFASELRAIHTFTGSSLEIAQEGLAEYLRYGYVPGPLSIFRGVKKLLPGFLLEAERGIIKETRPYWNLDEVASAGDAAPFDGDEGACIVELETRLRSAVRRHMVSDVPIGVFLSGGIDSSTVTALMQTECADRVSTFSIGFRERGYNEADHAATVARHLHTHHTELYVSEQDAQEVIPEIPEIYDEPFADVSQIPTYLVSRLARQSVTVVLSGDGGDELFGGYNRYLFVASFWSRLRWVPLSARRLLARFLGSIRPSHWDGLFRMASALAPRKGLVSLPGQKVHKVAALLKARSVVELQENIVSQWPLPEQLLQGAPDQRNNARLHDAGAAVKDPVARQMLWDMHTYLVDDILTKLDRASMRVGLEARVPLLDHTVVELAWRIPIRYKIRDGEGKWILRRVLEKYVPPAIFERPKMGFSIPIDEWLRGALRDWAETYLSEKRLQEAGYLNAPVIRRSWEQHLSGRANRGWPLWTVLMFETWRERVAQWG